MREEQRQIIQGLVTGDPSATHEFISLWYPRICQWVSRHSWLRPVEDTAQQVWCHLFENGWHRLLQWDGLYDDIAWHEHSLKGFLRTVTINKSRDLERAATRRLPYGDDPMEVIDDDGPLGTDPEVLAERERLAEIFDSCFRLIRATDQTNLIMWREGHEDADIALELSLQPNNVTQRRFQALRRLRECLQEKLPEYLSRV